VEALTRTVVDYGIADSAPSRQRKRGCSNSPIGVGFEKQGLDSVGAREKCSSSHRIGSSCNRLETRWLSVPKERMGAIRLVGSIRRVGTSGSAEAG
jgi:hypothetical protein